MNRHHKLALWTIGVAAISDVIFGLIFGIADHIGVGNGLYVATAIGTTSGYAISDQGGNFPVHGWGPHLLMIAMFITVIPLFTATFSLFTSGLTSVHVRLSEERMRRHVEQEFTRHRKMTGRAGG